mmetsp:Transcript_17126/g.42129  ORF Transcript_17126/g.42129 Transcript_17126/m.42129 type:complete len:239 (-) Transcript_17126:20-736(-)
MLARVLRVFGAHAPALGASPGRPTVHQRASLGGQNLPEVLPRVVLVIYLLRLKPCLGGIWAPRSAPTAARRAALPARCATPCTRRASRTGPRRAPLTIAPVITEHTSGGPWCAARGGASSATPIYKLLHSLLVCRLLFLLGGGHGGPHLVVGGGLVARPRTHLTERRLQSGARAHAALLRGPLHPRGYVGLRRRSLVLYVPPGDLVIHPGSGGGGRESPGDGRDAGGEEKHTAYVPCS